MTSTGLNFLRAVAAGLVMWLFAAASGAALAPQLRDMERQHAQYRLSVVVEAVIPTVRGAPGRLDVCKVRARVKRLVHARRPVTLLARLSPGEQPQPGAMIRTRVGCWAYDNRVFAPLVGQRIYYGGPHRFIHLELWGSFVGGQFVVFDFVAGDGA